MRAFITFHASGKQREMKAAQTSQEAFARWTLDTTFTD